MRLTCTIKVIFTNEFCGLVLPDVHKVFEGLLFTVHKLGVVVKRLFNNQLCLPLELNELLNHGFVPLLSSSNLMVTVE